MIRNENKGLRNKIKIAAWELECGLAEVEVGGDLEACRETTNNTGSCGTTQREVGWIFNTIEISKHGTKERPMTSAVPFNSLLICLFVLLLKAKHF